MLASALLRSYTVGKVFEELLSGWGLDLGHLGFFTSLGFVFVDSAMDLFLVVKLIDNIF